MAYANEIRQLSGTHTISQSGKKEVTRRLKSIRRPDVGLTVRLTPDSHSFDVAAIVNRLKQGKSRTDSPFFTTATQIVRQYFGPMPDFDSGNNMPLEALPPAWQAVYFVAAHLEDAEDTSAALESAANLAITMSALVPPAESSEPQMTWNELLTRDFQGAKIIRQDVSRKLNDWGYPLHEDDLEDKLAEAYSAMNSAWKNQPLRHRANKIAQYIVTETFEQMPGGGKGRAVSEHLNANKMAAARQYHLRTGGKWLAGVPRNHREEMPGGKLEPLWDWLHKIELGVRKVEDPEERAELLEMGMLWASNPTYMTAAQQWADGHEGSVRGVPASHIEIVNGKSVEGLWKWLDGVSRGHVKLPNTTLKKLIGIGLQFEPEAGSSTANTATTAAQASRTSVTSRRTDFLRALREIYERDLTIANVSEVTAVGDIPVGMLLGNIRRGSTRVPKAVLAELIAMDVRLHTYEQYGKAAEQYASSHDSLAAVPRAHTEELSNAKYDYLNTVDLGNFLDKVSDGRWTKVPPALLNRLEELGWRPVQRLADPAFLHAIEEYISNYGSLEGDGKKQEPFWVTLEGIRHGRIFADSKTREFLRGARWRPHIYDLYTIAAEQYADKQSMAGNAKSIANMPVGHIERITVPGAKFHYLGEIYLWDGIYAMQNWHWKNIQTPMALRDKLEELGVSIRTGPPEVVGSAIGMSDSAATLVGQEREEVFIPDRSNHDSFSSTNEEEAWNAFFGIQLESTDLESVGITGESLSDGDALRQIASLDASMFFGFGDDLPSNLESTSEEMGLDSPFLPSAEIGLDPTPQTTAPINEGLGDSTFDGLGFNWNSFNNSIIYTTLTPHPLKGLEKAFDDAIRQVPPNPGHILRLAGVVAAAREWEIKRGGVGSEPGAASDPHRVNNASRHPANAPGFRQQEAPGDAGQHEGQPPASPRIEDRQHSAAKDRGAAPVSAVDATSSTHSPQTENLSRENEAAQYAAPQRLAPSQPRDKWQNQAFLDSPRSDVARFYEGKPAQLALVPAALKSAVARAIAHATEHPGVRSSAFAVGTSTSQASQLSTEEGFAIEPTVTTAGQADKDVSAPTAGFPLTDVTETMSAPPSVSVQHRPAEDHPNDKSAVGSDERAQATMDEEKQEFAKQYSLAKFAALDTEWFDPLISDAPQAGMLDGAIGFIRADVRRFQLSGGEWITDFTTRIHLSAQSGIKYEDVRWIAQQMSGTVEHNYNEPRFRLPNGDRLHLTVKFLSKQDGFLDESDRPHHVVRVHATPGYTTTTDLHLINPDGTQITKAQIGHEYGHLALGLPDQNHDPDMLFRRDPDSSGTRPSESSVMAGDPGTGRWLSDENLSRIESLASSLVIYELPHPKAPKKPTKLTSKAITENTLPRAHSIPRRAHRARPPLAAANAENGHRAPAAPQGQVSEDYEESYTRQIELLLRAQPVDVERLLHVLTLRASTPTLYTPSSLQSTFSRLFGMPLQEAIDQAVRNGRLPEHARIDVLRLMGLVGDSVFADEQELKHIKLPDETAKWNSPDVMLYAYAVHDAFEKGDIERGLNLLRAFDRRSRSVHQVAEAWENLYATDMLQSLTSAWPAYSGQISHALGDLVFRGPVPWEQANALFQKLNETGFRHPQHGSTRVDPRHPEDGCYLRAHLWADELIRSGVMPRKVFIARSGDLGPYSVNARGAANFAPGRVVWRYHVAPCLDVMRNGKSETMVFDLALGSGPMTIPAWVEASGVSGDFHFVAGSLPEVQLHLGERWVQDPTSWEFTTESEPKETTVVLTEVHAWSFPYPTLLDLPKTLAEANEWARSSLDAAYQYSVEAEKRQLERNIWDLLYAISTLSTYSQEILLGQLRTLLPVNPPRGLLDNFLARNKELTENLQKLLGPYFYEFSSTFPTDSINTLESSAPQTSLDFSSLQFLGNTDGSESVIPPGFSSLDGDVVESSAPGLSSDTAEMANSGTTADSPTKIPHRAPRTWQPRQRPAEPPMDAAQVVPSTPAAEAVQTPMGAISDNSPLAGDTTEAIEAANTAKSQAFLGAPRLLRAADHVQTPTNDRPGSKGSEPSVAWDKQEGPSLPTTRTGDTTGPASARSQRLPVPGFWDAQRTRFILDLALLSPDDSLRAQQVTATRKLLDTKYPSGPDGRRDTAARIEITAADPAQTGDYLTHTTTFAQSLATHLGSIELTLPSGQTINICT
ncbi:hypothetical protein FNH09_39355 [Streptomyces adustus]|uniref:Protein glutaminase domain-containing protein n=1 Tax=Streptomyces adustus TaxID=1609272 RepID=A0A5N8VQL8_9ACTN|nr:protein-glutamine glutaminase family protein [Streptomyces adustus]MPY37062.1 hypothetical protein [Streptomyces adustus]